MRVVTAFLRFLLPEVLLSMDTYVRAKHGHAPTPHTFLSFVKKPRPGRLSRVMVCCRQAKNEDYRAHILSYVSSTQLVSLDTANYCRASPFSSVFLPLFNHLVFLIVISGGQGEQVLLRSVDKSLA